MNDESKNAWSTTNGLLGATPNNYGPIVIYSKVGPSKFKKERVCNIYCDHYKIKGHVQEKCYKLVGYPSNYPPGVNKKIRFFLNTGSCHNAHHI